MCIYMYTVLFPFLPTTQICSCLFICLCLFILLSLSYSSPVPFFLNFPPSNVFFTFLLPPSLPPYLPTPFVLPHTFLYPSTLPPPHCFPSPPHIPSPLPTSPLSPSLSVSLCLSLNLSIRVSTNQVGMWLTSHSFYKMNHKVLSEVWWGTCSVHVHVLLVQVLAVSFHMLLPLTTPFPSSSFSDGLRCVVPSGECIGGDVGSMWEWFSEEYTVLFVERNKRTDAGVHLEKLEKFQGGMVLNISAHKGGGGVGRDSSTPRGVRL